MVYGVFLQIKDIHHSSFLYENSDFPTFYPETFSSRVCHQGAYRFGSPVFKNESEKSSYHSFSVAKWHNNSQTNRQTNKLPDISENIIAHDEGNNKMKETYFVTIPY